MASVSSVDSYMEGGKPLVRRKTGGWKATLFIYVLIFGDALSVFGVSVNAVTYTYGTLHLSIANSAILVSNFVGLAFILPLFWAFIADSYVGRFWIIMSSFTTSLMGLLVLTLSVSLKSLRPPTCVPTATNPFCPEASHYVQNWFKAALYLIALGSAGLKPTLLSLGQDQFDETDPAEIKQGRHFFAGYYIVLNVATVLCTTVLVYVQSNVGFDWGYGVILGLYFAAIVLYIMGTPLYRQTEPTGSVLAGLAQVLAASAKNFNKPLPADPRELYELPDEKLTAEGIRKILHTDRLRFFDKAAIKPDSSSLPGSVGKWDLCTVTKVEEFKSVLQILPVFLCSIAVWAMYGQVTSIVVEQASTMDRKLGNFTVPAATSIAFVLIAGLIFLPIYEKFLVPQIRRITGHPRGLSPLRRMGVAFVLAILAMIVSAQVEERRVKVIKDNNVTDLQAELGEVPMSIWWLIPQNGILGIVEVLLGVAQVTFYYEETPDAMRSMATSLFYVAISVGYFGTSALVHLGNRVSKSSGGWLAAGFNRGGLRNYYYMLTTIVAVVFVIFLGCAHWYQYKVQHREERNLSKVKPGHSNEVEDQEDGDKKLYEF